MDEVQQDTREYSGLPEYEAIREAEEASAGAGNSRFGRWQGWVDKRGNEQRVARAAEGPRRSSWTLVRRNLLLSRISCTSADAEFCAARRFREQLGC